MTDLEPCVGAYGHFVALRVGDLCYRLHLDFQHEWTVHTAEFTVLGGGDRGGDGAHGH